MSLDSLLKSYREASRTERDKGTCFERLSVAFLENDPVQSEQNENIRVNPPILRIAGSNSTTSVTAQYRL